MEKTKMTKNIYFLDLETTQKKFYDKYQRTEMRLGVLSNRLQYEDDNQFKCNYFFSMKDLMEKVMNLKKDNSIIYVCNLDFDARFIMEYLFANVDLVDDVNENDLIEGKFTSLDKRYYEVGDPYIIDFCIKDDIISLKVRWINGKKTEFRCFFRLYAGIGSVKNFGKILGLEKLEEDITAYDCSYEEFMSNSKEWLEERKAYAKRDIEIPYRFSQLDWKTNKESPMRMKKIPLTAASLSMKITKNKAKDLFKWLWNEDQAGNKYLDIENDKEWLQYRGGFTFQNVKHIGEIINDTYSIDINSSYPYQYTTYKVPCVKPNVYSQLPSIMRESRLYALYISINKAIFKDNDMKFPPFLAKFDLAEKGTYIHKFEDKAKTINVMIWYEELQWLEKYYDLEYKIEKVYEFKTTDYLIKHTKELVDKKFTAKDKMEKALVKILINSLYGKFGQKPEMPSKYYSYRAEKWLEKSSSKDSFPYYPPVASFISMKARTHLYKQIENLNKLGAVVLYGDTDSLKFGNISMETIEANKDLLKIGNKLGEWELEGHYETFKYLAPKSYISIDYNGKKVVKLKGYNGDRNSITMDQFNIGTKFYDKKQGRNVKGGVLIVDNIEYTIKQSKYLINKGVE